MRTSLAFWLDRNLALMRLAHQMNLFVRFCYPLYLAPSSLTCLSIAYRMASFLRIDLDVS
jgi:hypothetical protein